MMALWGVDRVTQLAFAYCGYVCREGWVNFSGNKSY